MVAGGSRGNLGTTLVISHGTILLVPVAAGYP